MLIIFLMNANDNLTIQCVILTPIPTTEYFDYLFSHALTIRGRRITGRRRSE